MELEKSGEYRKPSEDILQSSSDEIIADINVTKLEAALNNAVSENSGDDNNKGSSTKKILSTIDNKLNKRVKALLEKLTGEKVILLAYAIFSSDNDNKQQDEFGTLVSNLRKRIIDKIFKYPDSIIIGNRENYVFIGSGEKLFKNRDLVASISDNLYSAVSTAIKSVLYGLASKDRGNIIVNLVKEIKDYLSEKNEHIPELNYETSQDQLDLQEFDDYVKAILHDDKKYLNKFLSSNKILRIADKEGKTLLHYAAENNKIDFVEKFIASGADTLAKDKYENTSIHYIYNAGKENFPLLVSTFDGILPNMEFLSKKETRENAEKKRETIFAISNDKVTIGEIYAIVTGKSLKENIVVEKGNNSSTETDAQIIIENINVKKLKEKLEKAVNLHSMRELQIGSNKLLKLAHTMGGHGNQGLARMQRIKELASRWKSPKSVVLLALAVFTNPDHGSSLEKFIIPAIYPNKNSSNANEVFLGSATKRIHRKDKLMEGIEEYLLFVVLNIFNQYFSNIARSKSEQPKIEDKRKSDSSKPDNLTIKEQNAEIKSLEKEIHDYLNGKNNKVVFLDFFFADTSNDEKLKSNPNIVEILQNIPAKDINRYNLSGCKPLQCALRLNNLELVKSMLEKGAAITQSFDDKTKDNPLHYATRHELTRIMEELLKSKDKLPSYINEKNADGDTALMLAIRSGNISSIIILLEHSADLNIQNNKKESPWAYANHGTNQEIKLALFTDINNINQKDQDGKTPLIIAIEINSYFLIEYFLRFGAKISLADANAKTPLHYIAENGRSNLIVFIDNYEDVFKQDRSGNTPIHLAYMNKHFDMLEYLFEQILATKPERKDELFAITNGQISLGDIDDELKNRRHTFSKEADEKARQRVIGNAGNKQENVIEPKVNLETFLENPSLITQQDSDGNTAIHIAYANGDMKAVSTLFRAMKEIDTSNDKWKWLDITNKGKTTLESIYKELIDRTIKIFEKALSQNSLQEFKDLLPDFLIEIKPFSKYYLEKNKPNVPERILLKKLFTILYKTCEQNKNEIFKLIFEQFNDKLPNEIKQFIGKNNTYFDKQLLPLPILHVAIRENNVELVHYLIDNGADLEVIDPETEQTAKNLLLETDTFQDLVSSLKANGKIETTGISFA